MSLLVSAGPSFFSGEGGSAFRSAANGRLRELVEQRATAAGIEVRVPRPGLCTDNGAMVAALGAEVVRRGLPPSSLDLPVDSSMPVTQVVAA